MRKKRAADPFRNASCSFKLGAVKKTRTQEVTLMAEVQAFHRERGEWVTVRRFPTVQHAFVWLRRKPNWGYRYRVMEVSE